MVGVGRSNGCLSCKKSRVKCDEAKAVCGRCRAMGRNCVYADKFKFVDETSKRTSSHDSADGQSDSGRSEVGRVAQPKRGVYFYTSEKRTKNGGLFQKWHKSTVHVHGDDQPGRSPPLSPADVQRHLLVRCWSEGPRGMRFDLCAGWLKDIPERLGTSRALDDAVRLLSNVHTRMIREQDPSRWMCLSSYGKSLRSLRKALVDPVEGYKIETIASATILHHVEEILGDLSYNFIRHAGGIALLVEKRGIVKLESELDWSIIGSAQTQVISNSVLLGTPCFVSQPAYREYLLSFKTKKPAVALIQQLIVQFSYWPALISQVRRLRAALSSSEEAFEARGLLIQVKQDLDAIGAIIDEHIALAKDIVSAPTRLMGSIFEEVFEFGHQVSWPALINLHCAYTIIVDNIAGIIDGYALRFDQFTTPTCERFLFPDKYEQLVTKVCRTYEWSSFLRPLMASTSVFSLGAAYSFAQTHELREWILKCLNQGDEHRQLQQMRFTHETVSYLNQIWIGAVDMPRTTTPTKFRRDQPYGEASDSTSGEE